MGAPYIYDISRLRVNQKQDYLSNSNLSSLKRCSFSSLAFLMSSSTSISRTLQIKIGQAFSFFGFMITVYTYPVGLAWTHRKASYYTASGQTVSILPVEFKHMFANSAVAGKTSRLAGRQCHWQQTKITVPHKLREQG